jgi:hypothetical protein
MGNFREVGQDGRSVWHYKEKKDTYSVRVGKPEGKKQFARPRYIWKDNIKTNLTIL